MRLTAVFRFDKDPE